MQRFLSPFLSCLLLTSVFLSCNDDPLPDLDGDNTEIPLGPAPNDRVTGSFQFNKTKFKAQTNATNCNPSVKDNNAYFLSMRSTILYNGNVGMGTVYIALPQNNIRSTEYDIIVSAPQLIDFTNSSSNAVVYFYLNTSAPNGGGENIEGYATGGKLWVKYEDDQIVARFEDLPLNEKPDGSGKDVGSLSGAIDCGEDAS